MATISHSGTAKAFRVHNVDLADFGVFLFLKTSRFSFGQGLARLEWIVSNTCMFPTVCMRHKKDSSNLITARAPSLRLQDYALKNHADDLVVLLTSTV
jgi:hypothetical protein